MADAFPRRFSHRREKRVGGGEGVTGGRELMLVHKIFTFVQAILSTNLLEGTLCRPGVFCRLQNAECRMQNVN